jgi:four helix bundle protein
MSEITSYRDLVTWQRTMELVLLVYRITAKFPRSEQFGLAAQIRKAAVSTPSNVAEGTRHRTAGYISRVEIALGEQAELETEMMLSERIGYVPPPDAAAFQDLSAQVGPNPGPRASLRRRGRRRGIRKLLRPLPFVGRADVRHRGAR